MCRCFKRQNIRKTEKNKEFEWEDLSMQPEILCSDMWEIW